MKCWAVMLYDYDYSWVESAWSTEAAAKAREAWLKARPLIPEEYGLKHGIGVVELNVLDAAKVDPASADLKS